MNFDEERVHPAAARLLTDASRAMWAADLGPLNTDAGHDAARQFRDWRADNPDRPASELLASIAEGWDVAYRPELADEATVGDQLADADDGDVGAYDEIYVRDETIIATFLAQILDEGHVDGHARGVVRVALKRQSHPLVVERFFADADAREKRQRALREASRLLEAAADAKAPGGGAPKAKTPKRRGKNEPGPCPWPVGSVLSYTLPSSKRILIHHFAVSSGPWFYVLDWIGDVVPPAEVVQQLDIKPSTDQWKFGLILPPVDALELPSGYQARLEQVLRPTGVSMPSHRDPLGTLVFWQNLAEYIATKYDFDGQAGT